MGSDKLLPFGVACCGRGVGGGGGRAQWVRGVHYVCVGGGGGGWGEA